MERLLRIDGLRWLAALIVFFNHFAVIFLPNTFWGAPDGNYNSLVIALHDTPLGIFVNGNFAIHIFLAISGFGLYLSWQAKASAINIYTYAQRYLRLMIPTLSSILLAYAIVAVGALYVDNLAFFTAESPWLLFYGNLQPNLFDAAYQGVYHVFFKFGQSFYNPVVWVLGFFWIGSVVLLTVLASFKVRYYHTMFFSVLAGLSIFFGFSAFWLGALLAILYTSPRVWNRLKFTLPPWSYVVALIIGVILGSYPSYMTGVTNLYSYLELPYIGLINTSIIYHMIASGIIFAIILLDPRQICSRLLDKWSQLGKYSYALYLTHALVLVSLSSWLWLKLRPLFSYNITTGIVLVVSIIAIVPVYRSFYKFVEQPAMRLIKSIYG